MGEIYAALFWPLVVICAMQALKLWLLRRERQRQGLDAIRRQQEAQAPWNGLCWKGDAV